MNQSDWNQKNQNDGNRRRLTLTLVIMASYMGVEIAGGIITNSLALLADAVHMLSDVGALGLSLFALWIARRPATPERTFGYARTEILAALANGAVLVAIAINIFIEAYRRLDAPPAVRGGLMLGIASLGLLVNVAGLFILNRGRGQSLNVRGAWLHVFTDALGSVGAMASGALIWRFGWRWADPAASVIIGVLVLFSAGSLLRETLAVLMEGAPAHIDTKDVQTAIAAVSGVLRILDLHIWSISSGRECLSAHIVLENDTDPEQAAHRISSLISDNFNISHTTIQVHSQNPDTGPQEDFHD